MHLNAKDNNAAYSGDKVGDEHEDASTPQHPALNHEANATDGHHHESNHRDVVRPACPDSTNGLRQITENESKAGYPAANVKE